jgi:hypothetical protein
MKEFETLAQFAEYARERAQIVEDAARDRPLLDRLIWENAYLNPNPNEDECRFCRAMSTCPAAARKVENVVGAAFEVIAEVVDPSQLPPPAASDQLAVAMQAVGFLEDWSKAVRAEVERRLLAGEPVKWGDGEHDGFGLGMGREGNRQWTDPAAVTEILRKQFRLTIEQTFELELKSPTEIEKMGPKRNKKGEIIPAKPGALEPTIGARQWDKLQPLIKRNPAKPSVQPLAEIKKPYTVPTVSPDAFAAVDDDTESLN